MIGETAGGGFDWGILASVLLFVLSAVLSVVGFFLKRLIEQNDKKICLVREELADRCEKNEERIREVELGSVTGDGAIREAVARDYVPEARCTRLHQDTSQTIGKIFLRLDDLAANIAALAATVKAAIGRTPA
jgi:hypothetical protein